MAQTTSVQMSGSMRVTGLVHKGDYLYAVGEQDGTGVLKRWRLTHQRSTVNRLFSKMGNMMTQGSTAVMSATGLDDPELNAQMTQLSNDAGQSMLSSMSGAMEMAAGISGMNGISAKKVPGLKAVDVTWEYPGKLGIVLLPKGDELQPDCLFVASVTNLGVPGDLQGKLLHEVNGEQLQGRSCEEMLALVQEAPRPLTLRFQTDPSLEVKKEKGLLTSWFGAASPRSST